MKKPLIISGICIAAALLLFMFGLQPVTGRQSAPIGNYALVIESDTGAFVMQLQKGVRQAADEAGVHIWVCTESELGQLADLSGAVLWLSNPQAALSELKRQDIAAVVVDQEINDAVCVLGDDRSAGQQLIRFGLDRCDHVTLLLDDIDAHASSRSAAASAWSDAQRVAMVHYAPGAAMPEETEAVVCTSLRATKDMVLRKASGSYTGQILGVDTGESRVDDLESGLITAMVLDSPYAMGYVALNTVLTLRQTGAADNAFVRVLLASQDNMYLSENVKQVFPLLN